MEITGLARRTLSQQGGLSAEVLKRWWGNLWHHLRCKRTAEETPCVRGSSCVGCRVRFDAVAPVGTGETDHEGTRMLKRIHRVIVPGQVGICDESCPHIVDGLLPSEAQELLAYLQQRVDDARAHHGRNPTSWASDDWEDALSAHASLARNIESSRVVPVDLA